MPAPPNAFPDPQAGDNGILLPVKFELLMSVALSLHALSAVLWVGGMLFAHMILRPVAANLLEPSARLSLWAGVFERFFPWVWASVGLLLVTGFWMILWLLGGFTAAGLDVHLMTGLGIIMMGIFMYIFFVPYRQLKAAVVAQQWSAGIALLGQIRRLVGVNAMLGVIVTTVGVAGRYLTV